LALLYSKTVAETRLDNAQRLITAGETFLLKTDLTVWRKMGPPKVQLDRFKCENWLVLIDPSLSRFKAGFTPPL
jgi:hypothetical protein